MIAGAGAGSVCSGGRWTGASAAMGGDGFGGAAGAGRIGICWMGTRPIGRVG
jgi:hypothetical protein